MYAFWIAADGTFGLTRWDQGVPDELIPPGQPGPFVRSGADNELVLRIQGSELIGWINGRLAFDLPDPHARPLPAGTWGLYALGQLGAPPVQADYTSATIYRRNA